MNFYKIKSLVTLFAIVFSVCGCVTLTSASLTGFKPQKQSKVIKAETSKGEYLHLLTPDLSLRDQLKEKCPNGDIQGVETSLTMREFILVQYYTLSGTGYCVEAPGATIK